MFIVPFASVMARLSVSVEVAVPGVIEADVATELTLFATERKHFRGAARYFAAIFRRALPSGRRGRCCRLRKDCSLPR